MHEKITFFRSGTSQSKHVLLRSPVLMAINPSFCWLSPSLALMRSQRTWHPFSSCGKICRNPLDFLGKSWEKPGGPVNRSQRTTIQQDLAALLWQDTNQEGVLLPDNGNVSPQLVAKLRHWLSLSSIYMGSRKRSKFAFCLGPAFWRIHFSHVLVFFNSRWLNSLSLFPKIVPSLTASAYFFEVEEDSGKGQKQVRNTQKAALA